MNYIHRDMKDRLEELAQQYPVVTVLGPRQSGKTTLVRHVFQNKPYVSLENLDIRGFAQSDPRAFLEQYPQGAVLDEIQRAPSLLSYIQGIVDDTNQHGMYVLTGSHQLELHASITQSLAGRTVILKLLPFSMSELSQNIKQEGIDYFLYHGMYPRIYDSQLDPTLFYGSYLQTYVERDVRQMLNIKDLSLFQTFIKLCASRVGQIFNANTISNELGISVPTVGQWLSILEASFIVFRLQPYFENFGKRVIKSPKLYFNDVGLASYCLDIETKEQVARDPLRGNLVENFVITEIMKLRLNQGLDSKMYFYRDSNQNEVDLIIKRGHELYPIEIKASKTFHTTFLKGLRHFNSIAKERSPKGFLIYTGDHEQRIENMHIINFHNIQEKLKI